MERKQCPQLWQRLCIQGKRKPTHDDAVQIRCAFPEVEEADKISSRDNFADSQGMHNRALRFDGVSAEGRYGNLTIKMRDSCRCLTSRTESGTSTPQALTTSHTQQSNDSSEAFPMSSEFHRGASLPSGVCHPTLTMWASHVSSALDIEAPSYSTEST
jgi:hypothetical protein